MSSYPPGMVLRPIEQWPGPLTTERRYSPFKASFSSTLELLSREFRLLEPSERPVLQIALEERYFRLDGMPRAGAKPEHPGVIVNVKPSGRAELSFPCDTFTHWHDNLRAIALTLEALRKIDRYGVTQTGQQYRGWQALEAGTTAGGGTMEAACLVIARIAWPNENADTQREWANKIATDPEIGGNTYRKARINAHPDRHGGDRQLSDEVESAALLLRKGGASWL